MDGPPYELTQIEPFSRDPTRRLRWKPKGVQKARLKHELHGHHEEESYPENDRDSHQEPTLMDRFYSLPLELRHHVYRQLLVQPCKFDMCHKPENCTPATITPYGLPYSNPTNRLICASCTPTAWPTENPGERIFVSPARSRWAPRQTNELLCDKCYAENIRPSFKQHFPSLDTVPCLCTRHESLHVLLDYGRKFYKEAAPIFWSENWFAFENVNLLIGFLSSVRPVVRSWIRRVSVFSRFEPLCFDDYDEDKELKTEPSRELLKSCWKELRQCDGLTELELDASFLSSLDSLLSLRNVRVAYRVSFMHWSPPLDDELTKKRVRAVDDTKLVWKFFARRKPVVNDALADTMALIMTGRKPRTAKFAKKAFFGFEPRG